jgi:NitT/TauT family transport system substrate-binding protein
LLDEGVARVHELRSNTDVIEALTDGRLEVAALTLDEVLATVLDGVALKVVAVLDLSAGADVVLGRPGIESPAQARGRRVAAESSAAGALMLAAFLDAGGLTAGDIQLVPTPLPDTAQAWREGRAEVVVTAEPWASQLQREGALRLFDSRAIPGRIVDVLVAPDGVVARAAGQGRRLVQAHFRALARFQADPARIAPALARRLQLPPDEVLGAFRGLDLPGPEANRRLLAAEGDVARGLPSLARLLHDKGLIRKPAETDGLIDRRWLEGVE